MLEAFGGLYVSGKKVNAGFYAQGAVEAIEDYYWSSATPEEFDWAQPEVHRIFLLPGVELALDEDELGWAYIPNEENNWNALGLYYDHSVNLAIAAGVYDDMLRELGEFGEALEQEEEKDPNFYWEPMGDIPFIDRLTQTYVGPILEAWYALWQRFAPPPPPLPKLRLLNQQWYADPPIADRFEPGKKK